MAVLSAKRLGVEQIILIGHRDSSQQIHAETRSGARLWPSQWI
jgi:hypothetical protein